MSLAAIVSLVEVVFSSLLQSMYLSCLFEEVVGIPLVVVCLPRRRRVSNSVVVNRCIGRSVLLFPKINSLELTVRIEVFYPVLGICRFR